MIKEFFKSPKKTTILGLIGSSIMMIVTFMTINTSLLILNIYNLYIIGLVIYFVIILMRMLKQKGNVKVANYILVITYIVSFFGTIFVNIAEGESIVIDIIILVIIISYFCNILLRKLKFINNKVFAIVIIVISIYHIINILRYMLNYDEIEVYVILDFIKNLAYITIVPYFYNYYDLLKEEIENGK